MNERQKATTESYRQGYDRIFKKDSAVPQIPIVEYRQILPIHTECIEAVLDEVASERPSTDDVAENCDRSQAQV